MQLFIAPPPATALILLRRAGYSQYCDHVTHKNSFAKRLGQDLFPKFHIHVQETETSLTLDLHLDQKHASYVSHAKHSGEYDGELVERELARIQKVIDNYTPDAND